MRKLSKKNKDLLPTIAGLVLAVTTSWMLIDWENFVLNERNIFIILLSTINALAGKLTTLKDENE